MAKRMRVDTASASSHLERSMKLDTHPEKLVEGLNRLRLNKVLCDVILCCEGQEFPCHRVVLASISSYFEVNTHIYWVLLEGIAYFTCE